MLGLVLLVEAFLNLHSLEFSTVGAESFEFAGRAAHQAGGYDLLCFGDSQVKHGVLPLVLDAKLGKRALNLAMVGSLVPSTYLIFRRALDAGARPEAVIVDFSPSLLLADPLERVRDLAEMATPGEALEMAWTGRDPIFLADLLSSRLLRSVRARAQIRKRIIGLLTGDPSDSREALSACRRNWDLNRGAGILADNPLVESLETYWDIGAWVHPTWDAAPLNKTYLRKFLRLAAARQIRVYWVVPPINPKVQVKRDALGVDERYTRFVRAAIALYPNIVVVDARRAGFPTRLYTDSSHLDLEGAHAFSDDLAPVLRRHGPGPFASAPAARWVAMPAYRDRPMTIALEDERQSRVAAARGATIR